VCCAPSQIEFPVLLLKRFCSPRLGAGGSDARPVGSVPLLARMSRTTQVLDGHHAGGITLQWCDHDHGHSHEDTMSHETRWDEVASGCLADAKRVCSQCCQVSGGCSVREECHANEKHKVRGRPRSLPCSGAPTRHWLTSSGCRLGAACWTRQHGPKHCACHGED